jgi:hypothetical protein
MNDVFTNKYEVMQVWLGQFFALSSGRKNVDAILEKIAFHQWNFPERKFENFLSGKRPHHEKVKR